jgi:cytoplasmic tRNA 2-thiolation protein 1
MKYCSSCNTKKAQVIRPKTQEPTCLECFYLQFESEIHYTIISNKLFKKGEKVAIGASGGKDSTVLAYILNHLNKKYNYGLNLILLSVDEGITGYRDDSLATV